MFNISSIELMCKHVSKLQKAFIEKICSEFQEPCSKNICMALILLTLDHIIKKRHITIDQAMFIFNEFSDDICTYSEKLNIALTDKHDKLPICRLAIIDGTYVAMDGSKYLFNVIDGSKHTELDHKPEETITINMTTKFLHAKTLVEKESANAEGTRIKAGTGD